MKKAQQIKPQHSFTRKLKAIPWMVCRHCGLIKLNNDATKAAQCDREDIQ